MECIAGSSTATAIASATVAAAVGLLLKMDTPPQTGRAKVEETKGRKAAEQTMELEWELRCGRSKQHVFGANNDDKRSI